MISPAQKIDTFFTKFPKRTFDKREVLIYAEAELPGVFYLVEGRVGQYDITSAGNEVVVNVFKPGAFFPMSTALNQTPNRYFFEASTRVVAHLAPSGEAVQFLKDNPDVMFDLLSRVYRGVDGVLRRMAHLMGGDSKSRLLFELLNTAYRFGETRTDGAVFIGVNEGDLARQSGLARETVNRVLQQFKATGLVQVKRSGLLIRDLRELEDILGTAL